MFLIYEDMCPECSGGKVIRQLLPRYDVCSKNCGILLIVPSWREPEQKVSAVSWQVGDEGWQKMTREHYEFLSAAINIAAAKIEIGGKYPGLVDVFHSMR
ncbi:MAG: hypothetical protein ABIG73_01345 [Patescibacteria group bacterium]